MKKRNEKRTSEAILQTPQEIEIGGRSYMVSPPSTATLIKISELVAELPTIELNSDNLLTESLFIAKDCRVLGDIIAIMVLGAKRNSTGYSGIKKRLNGRCNEYKRLSQELLEEITPSELGSLVIKLLSSMQIESFFALTTSLIGINLLKQTRGVVTTASGQL